MARSFRWRIVLGLLVVVAGCGQQPPEDPAEAAYRAFREAYLDAGSRAEQVALVEGFVAEHADHRAAGYYATDLITYYGHDLGQPARAYEIVEPMLSRMTDPEGRLYLAAELAPVAADAGRSLDLAPYIAAVEAQGPLSFDSLETIMAAACKVGDWPLAGTYAEAAEARSTPEAWRADNPKRELSDEEVATRVQRRRVTTLTYRAWALYNQGQTAEALALFEQADTDRANDYLGLASAPLDRFWASALLREGDAAAALERISREAAFGDRDQAAPVFRQAWAAVNGSEDGLDEQLRQARQRLARTIDDFSLADYDGRQHSLSNLRRGKVLMLAFWFPT
jgi:tetratricopeptide (TPR) repeat protein